jgi:hypothetical protein
MINALHIIVAYLTAVYLSLTGARNFIWQLGNWRINLGTDILNPPAAYNIIL